MNLIDKIILKSTIEYRFFTEQKWSIKKPEDSFSISKSILKKYLPSNPVIIDCGAHIGADSIELARIFPACTIHCFEPVPKLYGYLINNSRKYRRNINCYNIALSNQEGYAQMHISEGASDASSSLLIPKDHLKDHEDVKFNKTIEVKTATLDGWSKENKIKQVDFLWLDMQGFERQMLEASNIILPTVKAIHTEVSTKETYAGVILYKEYRKWLESKGFKVELELIPEGSDMGNVLFIR